jgi:uncharacterized protein YdaU (DUF1376 family)
MAKPPAFQFYPKDYIASTRTMPVEARGVYTDLLAYAWEEEGLPSDLRGLEMFVGLSKRKFVSIWETYLADRWTSDGNGRLVNQRQEEEREKQRRWREKSAKGGRAGRKGS